MYEINCIPGDLIYNEDLEQQCQNPKIYFINKGSVNLCFTFENQRLLFPQQKLYKAFNAQQTFGED